MQLNINGKTIEVSNDDLKQALEENKETFDLKSDLIVRTQEEENIFSTNIRKEGQSSGAEFGRKNVLKSLGIEGEGLHKSDEKSLEAINNLINTKLEQGLKDANIEPNKKVEELLKDKEILQTQLQERNKAFSEFELKVGQERKENYIKSSIMSLIPDNTVIEKESIYTLITNNNINGIKFDVDENNQIFGIGSDGQPIKDSNALYRWSRRWRLYKRWRYSNLRRIH